MSRLSQYSTIFLVALLLVIAQLLLKAGMAGFRPSGTILETGGGLLRRIVTTPALLLGYAVGFVAGLFWLSVLSRLDLSLASPTMLAIYFVLLLVASKTMLKEKVSFRDWFGVLIIAVGIIMLSRGDGKL